jgi:hypothetical protein
MTDAPLATTVRLGFGSASDRLRIAAGAEHGLRSSSLMFGRLARADISRCKEQSSEG